MGIRFGGTTKCIEELTKLCLEHYNEVYMGKIDGKIHFESIDNVWSDQQHFLSKGMQEAIWLKDYYESMYSDVDKQKRVLGAIMELTGMCIDCSTLIIHKDVAYKIFGKWKVTDALMTEMFEIFIKRYYKFSLET